MIQEVAVPFSQMAFLGLSITVILGFALCLFGVSIYVALPDKAQKRSSRPSPSHARPAEAQRTMSGDRRPIAT